MASKPPRSLGSRTGVVLAACAVELIPGTQPPTEIRLAPAGLFRARDGRPEGLPGWRLEAASARRAIDWAEAQSDDRVIDYEHQTLNAERNGQPAPAAGWWREMQWREGDGLYAVGLRWTPRAAQHIADGEYRYFSPVIAHDARTGEVRAILMGALTNHAALDGLSDLTAVAAARFRFDPESNQEEIPVDRAKLIALLALAAGAEDTDIESAIAALKSKAEQAGRAAELEHQLAALKTATAPDTTQWVPRAVYDETAVALAALKTQASTAEIDRLIEQGLASGKIPGQATAVWLRGQGVAALKAYLDVAPEIAALKGSQTGGRAPKDESPDALSATEQAVIAHTGLSPEAYRKAKAA
jgi:phage I-like protein